MAWEQWQKRPRRTPVLLLLAWVTGVMATARGSDVLGLFFIALCILGVFFVIYRVEDRQLRNILLIALAARLGLALFQAFIAPLPDSQADATTFESYGWQNAAAWLSGEEGVRTSGSYVYSAWIGGLYLFFGRVPLIVQFVNVVLGVFTVYLVYKVAFQVAATRKTAQIAALVAAAFPTLNLYSAITMRENIIVAFTVLSVYLFLLWLGKGKTRYLLGAFAALAVGSAPHWGVGIIGLVYIGFYCFYSPRQRKMVFLSRRLVMGILLFFLLFVVFEDLGFHRFAQNPASFVDPERLEERVARAARDRTSYLEGMVPASHFDVFWQTPVRMLYLLFAPLPWMIESPDDLVGFFDGLLYLGLFVYTIRGLAGNSLEDKWKLLAVALVALVLIGVFAWGTSNYGTALRHRQKFVALLIILGSVGMTHGRWLASLAWLKPLQAAGRGGQ